jgi:multiple sugar transport system substrate-binding protein
LIKKLLLASVFGLTASIAALPAQAETTLDFASWQLEEPGNADWWKAVIAAFEAENTDIKITQTYIPFADYLTQLTVRFASNRAPAVLQISEQNYAAYAAQGWLAGLDDLIKGTDIETDWAAAQKELTWDNQTRGVIVSNSSLMLFYNSKLLEEAGVAVPTSFEEYQAAVAALTNPDAGVFGLSAVTTEHPTVMEDLHRYLGYAGTAAVVDGKYNLTSPEAVAAIETYRKVVGKNAPLGNNSAVARQLFVDGKTAFLVDGPWVWSWLEKATPEMRPNLHMVRTPWDPPQAPGGITLHIAEGLDEETKAAAWKFVLFASKPEWQREYLKITGQPAGRASSVLTEEDVAQFPHLKLIADTAADGVPLFPSHQAVRANFNEYSSILRAAALKVLSTDEPVEKILADAQAELERAVPLN